MVTVRQLKGKVKLHGQRNPKTVLSAGEEFITGPRNSPTTPK